MASEVQVSSVQGLLELLQGLHRGELVHEAAGNLGHLVETVKSRKKPGSLTLKIEVMPAGKDDMDEAVVHIRGTCTVKLPGIQRGANVWFVLGDNTLSRTPPNQAVMFGEGPRAVIDQQGNEIPIAPASNE